MKSILTRLLPGALLFTVWAAPARGAVFDAIQFGDPGSEQSHQFEDGGAEAVRCESNEAARVPQPSDPLSWRGGGMKFNLRVQPGRQNYVTFKFRGGETNENSLLLLVGGRQLGYRFFGDVEIPSPAVREPVSPGRFYYVTLPLPMSATYRRDRLDFELFAAGPVWLSGRTFAQFQKELTTPGRAICRMVVHDDPFYVPGEEEVVAKVPEPIPPESRNGSFDALKAHVNRELAALLADKGPIDQTGLLLLARAYHVPWTVAYRKEAVVEKVRDGMDELFRRRREDPGLARDDRSAVWPELTGFGPAGEAVLLLQKELEPFLAQEVSDAAERPVTRRRAWAELFEAGVRHLASARRPWAEQSLVIDRNLHWNDRALKFLDSAKGLPPGMTLEFLRESVGVVPWSGPVDMKGKSALPVEARPMLFTAKGLPKEYGYDGGRGEGILGLAVPAYEASAPEPGKPGDGRILEALRKIVRARSVFRYPALHAAGNRIMRLESSVGWRDTEFPGAPAYVQRPDTDSAPLAAAAALPPDGEISGAARRMLDDGQYFPALDGMLKSEEGRRVAAALLAEPDRYRAAAALPPGGEPMPMEGQKNFVWYDGETGVLAIKDGNDILYASLYWRAPSGVNFLAKVHHITPEAERFATVRQEVVFTPSGGTFQRPGRTTFGIAPGGLNYPGRTDSLHSGETLPTAVVPKEFNFKPGQEHPLAGRGDFYRFTYGPYLVGANMTAARSFPLTVPEKGRYRLLPDGGEVKPGEVISVGPGSATVLKRISK